VTLFAKTNTVVVFPGKYFVDNEIYTLHSQMKAEHDFYSYSSKMIVSENPELH
jgi:hypothetical protein